MKKKLKQHDFGFDRRESINQLACVGIIITGRNGNLYSAIFSGGGQDLNLEDERVVDAICNFCEIDGFYVMGSSLKFSKLCIEITNRNTKYFSNEKGVITDYEIYKYCKKRYYIMPTKSQLCVNDADGFWNFEKRFYMDAIAENDLASFKGNIFLCHAPSKSDFIMQCCILGRKEILEYILTLFFDVPWIYAYRLWNWNLYTSTTENAIHTNEDYYIAAKNKPDILQVLDENL